MAALFVALYVTAIGPYMARRRNGAGAGAATAATTRVAASDAAYVPSTRSAVVTAAGTRLPPRAAAVPTKAYASALPPPSAAYAAAAAIRDAFAHVRVSAASPPPPALNFDVHGADVAAEAASRVEAETVEAVAEEEGNEGGACLPRCGVHGSCRAGRCICAVPYSGPGCVQVREIALEQRPGPMLNFSFDFAGELSVSKQGLDRRAQEDKRNKKLTVLLPGKESDPDGGLRVLAEGKTFEALRDVSPATDLLRSRGVHASCAIVGSSGIVLSYEHGAEIDAHEMVMRFNSAPTKGFEKHVGSKTTHRITNTQNWGFHEFDDELLLIHFRAVSALKGLFWNAEQQRTNGKHRIPNPLVAFDPNYVEYIAHSLSFLATSGLYGILLAVQTCASVTLYGFQVSTNHGVPYHYYDLCDVPANVGRDGAEWFVVQALVQHGYVRFAEPCVAECHASETECDTCKQSQGFTPVEFSTAHCDPNRVSQGHLVVPWRREREARRAGRARGAHGRHRRRM